MKPVKRAELIEALLRAFERSASSTAVPREAHVAVEVAPASEAQWLPRLRILLADDSAANRKGLHEARESKLIVRPRLVNLPAFNSPNGFGDPGFSRSTRVSLSFLLSC